MASLLPGLTGREKPSFVYFLTILPWCKLVMMCTLQSFLTRAALLDNLRFRQKPPEKELDGGNRTCWPRTKLKLTISKSSSGVEGVKRYDGKVA